ncbi:MAG: hypothetical protein U1E28_11395 [Beijerinckiaceae bacterium]
MTHFDVPTHASRAKAGRLAPPSMRPAGQRPAPPPRAIAIAACIALVLVFWLGKDAEGAETRTQPVAAPSLESTF